MRGAAVLSVLATCCPCGSEEYGGERVLEADVLFQREPRWLGGDGAYSIDLGDDRTLWLFGDSFIATSPALTRRESTMVRNSLAVMTGRDPLTATMTYAWRDGAPPSAFFPDDGDHWFWPLHGARVPGGPLVIFLAELRPASGGLGFASAGFRVVRVADPSGPPVDWVVEPVASAPAPHDPDATVGTCTAIDPDGAHLVAVAIDTDAHHGRLARWPLAALAAGDLSAPAWWTGDAWIDQDELVRDPAVVLRAAGSECSLFFDGDTWRYVHSRGFGATSVALRWSARVEGPWSDPVDVFTPPESRGPDPFVYAAKAHPHLSTPGDYLVTYADNSFDFADLFDPARERTLYWPHVARIHYRFVCD